MTSNSVINEIDQLLPQTQCQKCGYKDCRAYAKAIAETGENINRCAPGGNEVIDSLSELTKRPRLELDKTIQATHLEATAMIDEEYCIGCTLCINACPIDSIIGAAKRTHTILTSICSGCGLCLLHAQQIASRSYRLMRKLKIRNHPAKNSSNSVKAIDLNFGEISIKKKCFEGKIKITSAAKK